MVDLCGNQQGFEAESRELDESIDDPERARARIPQRGAIHETRPSTKALSLAGKFIWLDLAFIVQGACCK